MKRIVTIISLSLVSLILITLLASCGLSTDDVAGFYVGSYTEDGSTYTLEITLTERGTYGKRIYQDDTLISSVANRYELKDEDVILYDSADKITYTVYHYTKGKLENNGNLFTKTAVDDSNEQT